MLNNKVVPPSIRFTMVYFLLKFFILFRHFLANFQMSSDFAEIWYTKVFECVEYENGVTILVRTFFLPKNLCFFGGRSPQKVTEN